MLHNRRLHVLILVVSLFFLLNGCSKKNIEGTVSDPFGKGLAGVEVQILKSQFKATTSSDGKYSIEYVPGTFTIQYAKVGYTTHKLDLNIQQKSKFPAELVTLYPIPKSEGFFLQTTSGFQELPSKQIKYEISGNAEHHVYRITDNQSEQNAQHDISSISIKAGTAIFVDNYPKSSGLFKIGNNNILLEYNNVWGSITYIYNGRIKDKSERVGVEELLLRKVELQPGSYAWCEVFHTWQGHECIGARSCYYFTVESSTQ